MRFGLAFVASLILFVTLAGVLGDSSWWLMSFVIPWFFFGGLLEYLNWRARETLLSDAQKTKSNERDRIKPLVLNSHIIIDSNIWIGENSINERFFEALEAVCVENKVKIDLVDGQYYAISNVNKETNSRTDNRDNTTDRAAHFALRRLESLLRSGCIDKSFINETVERKNDAYVDPQIRTQVLDCIRAGRRVTVFTEDVELRVLCLTQIPPAKYELLTFMTLEELFPDFKRES